MKYIPLAAIALVIAGCSGGDTGTAAPTEAATPLPDAARAGGAPGGTAGSGPQDASAASRGK